MPSLFQKAFSNFPGILRSYDILRSCLFLRFVCLYSPYNTEVLVTFHSFPPGAFGKYKKVSPYHFPELAAVASLIMSLLLHTSHGVHLTQCALLTLQLLGAS